MQTKEHSLCFTGHRSEKLPKTEQEMEHLKQKLLAEIDNAIENGIDTFYMGACYGFDLLAAQMVLRRKKVISLNNGKALSPQQGGYTCINPVQAMPKIISTNGSNNIDAIKKYFCSEYTIKLIANQTGMNYDVLIGGKYKLLIEPFAFYKFEGVMVLTTATEAAIYDEQVSGLLRKRMASLSHKNLPLAMFLEVSDLGYPAWGGSTTKTASNADIKSSLGLGIVRFTEQPEKPVVSSYDYEYRVNTEVITAVTVSGGQSDPDNPTTVSFNIDGTTYNVGNVYYPDGDSQLAWVKWTTPATEQDMVINVSVRGPGGTDKTTINCKIVDLDKNPPPNPVADDRNDAVAIAAQSYTVVANFVGTAEQYSGRSSMYTLDPLYGLDQPVVASASEQQALLCEFRTLQPEWWFNQEMMINSRRVQNYYPLIR